MRDWASEGKGNSEEGGITGERGKRRKDGSLRSESCENQIQGKVPSPEIFQLDLATEFLLCEWRAQNAEQI